MVKTEPESIEKNKKLLIDRQSFKFFHLSWFIFGSALIHGLLFLFLARYEPQKIAEPEKSKPIEFVVVPPEEKNIEPPPETNKRAQDNSVAPKTVEPPKTPTTDEIGEDIISQPSPPPVPKSVPEPQPSPPSAAKPDAKDSMTGQDAPVTPSETEQEDSVATRLPTKTEPDPATPKEGSAADLLGGDYKKTLADGGADAFFSPEALTHETVLNPGQIDALRDIDLSEYFAEIKRRVKRNWNPSYSSQEQTTYLTFNIQKNGQITNLKITESSGSEKLDRESMMAVQNSAPFAPLPPDFPLEALEIEFSFNIYLY